MHIGGIYTFFMTIGDFFFFHDSMISETNAFCVSLKWATWDASAGALSSCCTFALGFVPVAGSES